MKICKKTCVEGYKFSNRSTEIKCHIKTGWNELNIADCIPENATTCDRGIKYKQGAQFELMTCAKYKTLKLSEYKNKRSVNSPQQYYR